MGAICCHGNQSSNRIWPKTKCSQSPTPMILQMKFDYDWPAGLRDINVWKCGRTHGGTDGDTHGRRLESHTISSPWAFGSGELTNCPVIFSVFLKKEKCISKWDLSPGTTVSVVKCDFSYKVVILIRKVRPLEIFVGCWIFCCFVSRYNEVWLYLSWFSRKTNLTFYVNHLLADNSYILSSHICFLLEKTKFEKDVCIKFLVAF